MSADAGTLGYGATAWYTVNESLTISAGYNAFSYSASDIDASDTKFQAKLKLSNVPIILNWHPFKGTFRIFGGGSFSDNKVDVTGIYEGGNIEIGDTVYSAAQVGNLIGHAKISDGFSGLVGIGWSKAPTTKGWGGYVDLGVLLSGSPKVSLEATGPIKNDPTFQAELAKEVKSVNDEVDAYKVYPVVRAGVMYRF
ncbi:hypothetical protein [Nibricoccus sp. IMCC34717]|uniref:hypothetical protein n=1 Tax=Nibricoccus sp. IMCC34717 TaxID=3034021 RepID=UPI003850A539